MDIRDLRSFEWMKTKKRGANWRATRRYRTGLEIDDAKNNRRRCCVHNNKDGHYGVDLLSVYKKRIRASVIHWACTTHIEKHGW